MGRARGAGCWCGSGSGAAQWGLGHGDGDSALGGDPHVVDALALILDGPLAVGGAVIGEARLERNPVAVPGAHNDFADCRPQVLDVTQLQRPARVVAVRICGKGNGRRGGSGE